MEKVARMTKDAKLEYRSNETISGLGSINAP